MSLEPPTVGNIREPGARDDPNALYVGRAVKRGKWQMDASVYANPFTITARQTRSDALRQYEKMWRNRLSKRPFLPEEDGRWLALLRYLSGKRLLCWCSPQRCHADVLVRLWHEFVGQEGAK